MIDPPALRGAHLAPLLPAAMAEDDFTRRVVSVFEHVLADVVMRIDGVGSYFDPLIAPSDFVRVLGTWLNVPMHAFDDEAAARAVVAEAGRILHHRGTRAALEDALRLTTTCAVTVVDPGYVTTSDDVERGDPGPVVIRVSGTGPTVSEELVRSVADDHVPAGTPYLVVIEPRAGARS